MRREVATVRERLARYARSTTVLELELERQDREQQRAYRRLTELEEAIATEVAAQAAVEALAIEAGSRVKPAGKREGQVIALLERSGDQQVTPGAVATALNISPGYAYMLFAALVKQGRAVRVSMGVYRAP